jgi:hypothetical protein
MAESRIKRYALVPDSRVGAVRRFHLARVSPAPRSALGADRLERMEQIAELDRGRENGSTPGRHDL